MISDDQLAQLRFGMSDPPQPGGAPGDYEEKLSQWFLERSFFRDFTYRNPRGKKKGDELADAVVLFDDVALLIQVKAQHGNHEARAWATEAILKALKQVKSTHDDLKSGAIKKLRNDVYGEPEFNPATFPNMIGLIVIAQDSAPFDASELVPEIKGAGFPVFVFSLKDIALLTQRFDTAADFINTLELRVDIGIQEQFFVHDEKQNLLKMYKHVPSIYRHRMHPITDEVLVRSVEAFRETASGQLLVSPDWKFGMAIDDMIARAHDVDPDLAWNQGQASASAEIARYLGWFNRVRRIKLGKRIVNMCVHSEQTGEPEYFTHFQKARGTASVFFVSNLSREERVNRLQRLVTYAHFKYGVTLSFGVATDAGTTGRSYDFILTKKQLSKEQIEILEKLEDPFTDGKALL